MSRRLLALLTLLGSLLSALSAEPVTILVDASYSLSLSFQGRSRMSFLGDALGKWLREQPASTRYALLVVDHESDVELRLPYPAGPEAVSLALRDVVPWGSVDLLPSIAKAADLAASLAASQGTPSARLLLLTDGEDIAALLPQRLPRLPETVVFESVSLPPATPAAVAPLLATLAAPDRAIQASPPENPPGDPPPLGLRPDPDPAVMPTPVPVSPAAPGLLRRWAELGRWMYAGAFLIGLAAAGRASLRHRRRLGKAAAHNARPPVLDLEIRGPGGRTVATIDGYPAVIGRESTPFDHPDCRLLSVTIQLAVSAGSIVLSSPEKVTVNGVGRTEHLLAERDQIRIGPVRMVVTRIDRPVPVRPPRPNRRYLVAPAAAAFAAAASFAVAASPSTEPSLAAVPPLAARMEPPVGYQVTIPFEVTRPRETSEVRWAQPGTAVPSLPALVGPSDPLPDVRLDYLAFHAHPDDEAIDFGALLPRLHAAGLTGGIVLMTDGEAGLDQYPWRETGGAYPSHRLTGEQLAPVRIEEARQAIGWLGAGYYIRFGLPNHSYGSVLDVIPPEEIIRRWGGPGELTGRIVGLIEHFQPRIIISPDGPGPALEHFEHEATGLLVREALAAMDPGTSPVETHLVVIDSLQPQGYDDLVTICGWTPAADGTIPRLRQLLSLQAHQTQRDATVIGAQTRIALQHDYAILRGDDLSVVVELLQEALDEPPSVDPALPAP